MLEFQCPIVEYLSHRAAILELLSAIEEQDSVASAFLEAKQKESSRDITLEYLLLVPFMRFESYLRVVTSVLELTPAPHPDREELERTLQTLLIIQKVASQRDRENERLIQSSRCMLSLDRKFANLFDSQFFQMDAEADVTTSRIEITDGIIILLDKTVRFWVYLFTCPNQVNVDFDCKAEHWEGNEKGDFAGGKEDRFDLR